MTAEVMPYGVEPAALPEFHSVARYMFKVYDDEGGVYCTTCHRVMAGEHATLARHYRLCEPRRPWIAADASVTAYECGTCAKTMDNSEQWTFHFGTRDHWRRYNEAMLRSAHFQPSYEYTCEHCDTAFYDTEDRIKRHMYVEHDSGYSIHGWMRFMTAVYRVRSSYFTGAMHCCTGCDEIRVEKPVHDPLSPVCGGSGDGELETFFCDTCRLTFVGTEVEYSWHSSSPEHVALAQNLGGADADSDRWTLPRIVWCHFGGYPRGGGPDGVRTCGLCDERVPVADEHAVLSHLRMCTGLPTAAAEQLLPTPPSGKSAADYDAFRCGVCVDHGHDDDDEVGQPMTDFGTWSRHMTAGRHLMTPRAFSAYTYSECCECRTLYFGPQQRADDGSRCAGGLPRHRFRPFPVTDVMRYVYGEMNAAVADGSHFDDSITANCDEDASVVSGGVRSLPHFYYEQATGKFGRCDRSAEPAAVPFYCTACRLEFYGNRAAFRQHALTAEHMLLRQYAPFELSATGFCAHRTAAAASSGYTSGGGTRPEFERSLSYGWQVGYALDAIDDTRMKAAAKTAIGSVVNMVNLQQRQQQALVSGRGSAVSDRGSAASDDGAESGCTVVLRHASRFSA